MALRFFLAQGIPEALAAPLSYLFTRKVGPGEQAVIDRIEAVRGQLAQRTGVSADMLASPHTVATPDAFSARAAAPPPGPSVPVTLPRATRVASVSQYWGTFLHLCASASAARSILELGSCVGISGSYLASSRHCERFITVEGSSALAAIARQTLAQVADNFTVINCLFDEALSRGPAGLGGRFDLVYLDGQHEGMATRHYFQRIIPFLNPRAQVVLDDIHWSGDMVEAWRVCSRWPGVTAAVNVGRLGICLWDADAAPNRQYDLSPFISEWRFGHE